MNSSESFWLVYLSVLRSNIPLDCSNNSVYALRVELSRGYFRCQSIWQRVCVFCRARFSIVLNQWQNFAPEPNTNIAWCHILCRFHFVSHSIQRFINQWTLLDFSRGNGIKFHIFAFKHWFGRYCLIATAKTCTTSRFSHMFQIPRFCLQWLQLFRGLKAGDWCAPRAERNMKAAQKHRITEMEIKVMRKFYHVMGHRKYE